MKHINKKEIIAIILFSIAIVYLTTVPYKLAELYTPEGMKFMGFVGPFYDPNSYLAWCKQANEGKLLFEDKYTTEDQKSIFFHPYFLAVGKLSNIIGKSPEVAYEISRLFFGFVLLLTIYVFSIVYFGVSDESQTKRIFAFLFGSIASGFGWLFPGYYIDKLFYKFNFYSIDLWIIEGFTFLSIFIRPLFSITQILILWFFLFFYLANKNRKLVYSVLSGICSFVLGFVHPYDLVTIYSSVLIYIFFQFVISKKDIKFILLSSVFAVILSMQVFLYEYFLFTTHPVFSKWSQTVTVSPNPLSYFFGYGVLFIFSITGIKLAYKNAINKSNINLLILSWIFAVVILTYIPINFQRRLIIGIQVPLAMLTVTVIFYLMDQIKNLQKSKRLILVLILLIISIPSNLRYIKHSMFYVKEYYFNYYVYNEDYITMKWIDKNTRSDSIILSSPMIGLYIPGRTGNKVYTGHYDQTIDFNNKVMIVRKYFNLDMNFQERIKFLKDNRINYIYYGPFERMIGNIDLDKEQYLTLVYRNRLVKLYMVK